MDKERLLKNFSEVKHETAFFGMKMRDETRPSYTPGGINGLIELCEYTGIGEGSQIVEIGSWYGASTVLFANSGANVTAIDAWEKSLTDTPKITQEKLDEIERLFDENTAKYNNIKKMKGNGVEMVSQFEDNSLDLVYIDSNHNYSDTINMMTAWAPKVKPGGWLTGHDMYFDSVCRAVINSFEKWPVCFSDTSWAMRKEPGAGRVIRIGSAINYAYVPKAHEYLASLDKMVSSDHLKTQKFMITLGFHADDVLKQMYPTVSFIYKDINTLRWRNDNMCIQHGEFLDVLDASDEDVVVFTDADGYFQRDLSAMDVAFMLTVKDGDVIVGYNGGKEDNLLREYGRIGPKIDYRTVEERFGVNLNLAKCYNTGFMCLTKQTYNSLCDKYLDDIDFVSPNFTHYAKQQFLLGVELEKYFNVIECPLQIHSHGHSGYRQEFNFKKGVLHVPGSLWGLMYCQPATVWFRHHVPTPKYNVRLLLSDDGGCVWYRMVFPHNKMLFKYDSLFTVGADYKYDAQTVGSADIVVAQRIANIDHLIGVRNLMKPGAKLVWDGDDDYINIDKNNPLGLASTTDRGQLGLKTWLNNVDAITVSTPYLKDLYEKKFNRPGREKPVYVLPNCIDFNIWDCFYKRRQDRKLKQKDTFVRIGWHGGCSHTTDFEQFVPVVDALVKKYRGVIKFVIVGWDWSKLDCYKNVLPQDMVEFHDWIKEAGEFGKNLIDIDIGLAPLATDVAFNKSKSSIKYLEYSALGIPTVATDIEPYQEIENGVTGFKIKDNNFDAWMDAVSKLVENRELRKTIGEDARKWVKDNYDYNKKCDLWKQTYMEILGRGGKNDDTGCNH